MNIKRVKVRNIIIIILLALIFIAEFIYTGITHSWFTDRTDTGNIIMNVGKVDIDLDRTSSTTGVNVSLYRDSVQIDMNGNSLLPGDKINFSLQINNVGRSACYYLVCISTSDTMLAPSFNKYFFYNGSEVCYVKKVGSDENATLEVYKNSDNSLCEGDNISHLGKLDINTSTTSERSPNSFHVVTLQHELDRSLTEADFTTDSISIECSVFAIQCANITELEAYDEIIKMKENN